jgi:nitrogen fixation NifU-like protein
MMSELAVGMTLEMAYCLDDADIMHALGGLPDAKRHCSNHAAAALHEAIDAFVLGQRAGGDGWTTQ